MLDFDRLQTPEADGRTLIAPPAGQWPARVRESLERRGQGGITLAGHPLDEVRDATRRRVWGFSDDRPLIVSGHQPALIHPGVWAKYVTQRALMDRHGWSGGELVVDNDAPDGMALKIPCVDAARRVHICQISLGGGRHHVAYEDRPRLTAAAIRSIRAEVTDCLRSWDTHSLIETYLTGLADTRAPGDRVEQHLAGRRAIDCALAVDVPQARVSAVFGGPFVADLLVDAERFAAAYNDALAAYRRDHRVRGSHRPLPDLARDGDRVETALWIYRPGGPRRRLWVARHADRVDLLADEKTPVGTVGVDALRADTDAALAEVSPWVVRPRALTLTLWARLLVCELFVHGIGGAKYDRITDRIFVTYYGCEPPPYACVSATLQLPLPHHADCDRQLKQAERRLRDLHFNPGRYLSDPPPELLAERERLIAEAARLRAEQASRVARRRTFLAIRSVNERLAQAEPQLETRMRRHVEQLHACRESNRLASDREYFYALQPRDRLEWLADTLRRAVCG